MPEIPGCVKSGFQNDLLQLGNSDTKAECPQRRGPGEASVGLAETLPGSGTTHRTVCILCVLFQPIRFKQSEWYSPA